MNETETVNDPGATVPDNETITDDVDQDEEDDDAGIEATHICGIILLLNKDGMGLEINPIPDDAPYVERMATPDDILSLVAAAHAHVTGNVIAGKVANVVDAIMSGKLKKGKKPGRIITPGIGRG